MASLIKRIIKDALLKRKKEQGKVFVLHNIYKGKNRKEEGLWKDLH